VLNEIPIDFTTIPSISVDTLDAGNALQLVNVSAGTALQLPKDPDAASFGFDLYAATNPPASSYQGGANYQFTGPGGSEIGPFAVNVPAPQALNLIQPPLSASYSHNAATPLNLQWDGAKGVGEVNVELSGATLSTAVTIECRFSDDGNDSIPANLLTQMKNLLASSSGGIDIPGIELPPGFEDLIPGFGSQATLDVSRVNTSLFNTSTGDLDLGIAAILAGASLSVTLE
jgi:hypothetical protein